MKGWSEAKKGRSRIVKQICSYPMSVSLDIQDNLSNLKKYRDAIYRLITINEQIEIIKDQTEVSELENNV